jgi:putative endonuclease
MVFMNTNTPYFVYVLKSLSRNTFYIGVTENVPNRLSEHNQGISKYTKNRGPWELIHTEQYPNLSLARKREVLLKRQKGGIGFFKAIGMDNKSS